MQHEQQTSASGLAGRVALVTGGSGGIGRALALALSAAGVSVAIGYGASDAAAQQLAGQITAAGGRAAALSADLAYAAEVVRLTEDTEHAFGPVDVLVSNAGVGQRQRLEAIEVEEFDETVAVNLRAPFLLAQRLVPPMAERGFGRVLFISSVAAFTGGVVGPHYAAAKGRPAWADALACCPLCPFWCHGERPGARPDCRYRHAAGRAGRAGTACPGRAARTASRGR